MLTLPQLAPLASLPNVHFSSQRFSTFWASNTLLYLLLASFKVQCSVVQCSAVQCSYILKIHFSHLKIKVSAHFDFEMSERVG